MASEAEQNELYGLQTEYRHLTEMVGALRDKAKPLHAMILAIKKWGQIYFPLKNGSVPIESNL